MNFLQYPTRYLFFTGKGGVGKTSLSSATAVALADQGNRVFLVCTDPASNLSEVLGTEIGAAVVSHPEVTGLQAINIDPEKAAAKYREKVIGPYRDRLPEAALASMEEQLSGACTMEIAAFDEFAALLGKHELLHDFDYIIFDTAPTGHTLRLLQLPSAWDGFIETNTTGTSCLGPLAGLTQQHEMYKSTIKTLTNPDLTTVVLVCRPDTASLSEAARTNGELADLGMLNQKLIVNGVFRSGSDDETALDWEKRSQKSLASIPEVIKKVDRVEIPLLPFSPLGIKRLQSLWQTMLGEPPAIPPAKKVDNKKLPPPLSGLFNDIEKSGKGVIMTMGKGGVGKTTLATDLAKYLVQHNHKVLLATTDPAAHLDFFLGQTIGDLTVARIDPKEETHKYTAKVMAEAGQQLDEQGRKLLEEDLRSPCTEEIAVFLAFAQLVEQGEEQFIVLDTAPTGHTLLLLDAARAYHREVERTTRELPENVQKLLPRMRDPDFTKILIVTLPELTPVKEARQLEADLDRASITPYAWIINQSLAPLDLSDPLLVTKQQEEIPHITRLMEENDSKVFLAEWYAE
ncbi:MAG: arsenical pump-driving ATPase [Deltaproteobacteria bacterium]|jgi:arsenite-transporting ATPase|nr:arsenical pump-driving ATPase [Deltaproteobacteria bacterium]